MGRALLYASAVVLPPLYSQDPMKMGLNYNFSLSKTRGDVIFLFSPRPPPIVVTWSRGADKEPTWSVRAEIVIHQPAEQVRTDEGIQENNWWRRKGWGG